MNGKLIENSEKTRKNMKKIIILLMAIILAVLVSRKPVEKRVVESEGSGEVISTNVVLNTNGRPKIFRFTDLQINPTMRMK